MVFPVVVSIWCSTSVYYIFNICAIFTGAMFGGLTAIESTSGLLGSVLANFIYGETVAIYRGIAMAIFGVCHFIALCLIRYLV